MYKIVRREQLNTNVILMEVTAKEIAKTAKPGQFIILRVDEKGKESP